MALLGCMYCELSYFPVCYIFVCYYSASELQLLSNYLHTSQERFVILKNHGQLTCTAHSDTGREGYGQSQLSSVFPTVQEP